MCPRSRKFCISRDVIHTVRHDLAEFGVDKVVHLDLVGTAFRPVVAAGVPVGSDWLFSKSIEMTGLPAACMAIVAA